MAAQVADRPAGTTHGPVAGRHACPDRVIALPSLSTRWSVGLVIDLTAASAANPGRAWRQGSRLVVDGHARACLAPASTLPPTAVGALARVIDRVLTTVRPTTVAGLVRALDVAVQDHPTAARAWRAYRLIGDPNTPLPGLAIT